MGVLCVRVRLCGVCMNNKVTWKSHGCHMGDTIPDVLQTNQ